MYFRGQGKVYIGNRDTLGNPQNLRWVGDCNTLNLGFALDYIEVKESWSGQAQTALKVPKSKSTTLNFTLLEATPANLAQALYGTSYTVTASAPIVDEVLGGTPAITSLAVGMVFVAAKRNGSTISVKDSTGTAKTLVVDVNYSVEPNSMTIEVLDVTTGGPYVGPLKVSYTPGADSEIAMFNTAAVDKFMRFVGMNMADSGKYVTVDLYKCNIDPAKEISFIGEDIARFELGGAALIDSLKPSSATLGQFGAIYQQN